MSADNLESDEGRNMKEHLTKEQTDKLFMTITSNGCREMEEVHKKMIEERLKDL